MQRTANQDSVVHNTFCVERTYPSTPKRLFAAFSNQATKRRWFAEGEGWQVDEFTLDFRVGGYEISRFRFRDGPPMRNDTIFLDIVPDQRIVFAYTMTVGARRISVSLATVEIERVDEGARLVYTEQGAFFAGAEMPEGRRSGFSQLLDRLAAELQSQA